MTKIYLWEEDARFVEDTYGTYVDWDECFYHCPECGEPIYREDYPSGEGCCPVCELDFREEAGN